MDNGKRRIAYATVGGVGALLFFASALAAYLVPPLSGFADAREWVAAGSTWIMVSNELLAIATVMLSVGLIAYFRATATDRSMGRVLAMAALGFAAVVAGIGVMAEGRLVYPVYGLALSADSLNLMASLYFGAIHTIYLAVAVAALGVAFSKSRFPSRFGRIAGSIVAALLMAGSFPWLIGTVLNVGVAAVASGYLAALAIRGAIEASRPQGN